MPAGTRGSASRKGQAVSETSPVPQWVRDMQADRYLCTCGEPAISIWAGTGKPICEACLDRKLALNGNTLTNYWLYPTNGVLSNGVWGAYGAAVSGVATVTVSSSTSEIYAYTPALSCIKTNIAMTNTNGTMTTNLSTFINGVLYK